MTQPRQDTPHHGADRAPVSQVAALFVLTDGPYFGLPGVDPWDELRDARAYAGPHPVVAHPPCRLWGKMARVNFARWGGDHNRPGNDGGCFAAALAAVNKFGGVLEHPAHSYAWEAHGLKKPEGRWRRSGHGWVCEVWQSAYGHKANKATWLYFVGLNRPPELDWSRPVGTHQVGFQDRRGKERNKPTLPKLEAEATPPAFRDLLISLASQATAIRVRQHPSGKSTRAHDQRSQRMVPTRQHHDAEGHAKVCGKTE